MRALENLVSSLEGRAEVFVLTRDRDYGSSEKYSNIKSGEWNGREASHVFYATSLSWTVMRRVITDLRPDLIYVNSFFSPITIKVLLLRVLGLIPGCPIIVAPHGELHPGALSIKRTKKSFYIQVALRAGLYRGVLWHATTMDEKQMILKIVPKGMTATPLGEKDVLIAENVAVVPAARSVAASKESGIGRFLFVGRISRKKNLRHAIRLLSEVKGTVVFDIFGMLEDTAYWQECLEEISQLPGNITVAYRGIVNPDVVQDVFAGGHFFLFPTLGENYGYTVVESLSAGCPVVTSTEVPWLEMEEFDAGWCVHLTDIASWRRILQRCVDMDQNEYESMVAGARAYCDARINAAVARQKTLAMFEQAAARS